MNRPPDPHELARRFLDLWQDQVQAMATDPEVADAVRRWTALWAGAARPYGAPGAHDREDGLQPGYRPGGGTAYDAGDSDERGEHGRGAQQWRPEVRGTGERRPTAAGSAANAAVSGHGDDDLAVVLRELRRLEARIARLEERLERGGEQPEGPARGPGGRAGSRKGRPGG